MKMVPSPATKVEFRDGRLHGEWSDRALDDGDRYTAPNGVFLKANVPAESAQDLVARRLLNQALVNEFDRWIKATRS